MLDKKITAYGNQTHVANGIHIEVGNVFRIIQDNALKHQILAIRSTNNATLQNEWKNTLPKVTWNGTFLYRNSQGLINYSGLTAIDIDLTKEQIGESQKLKETFAKDPCVLASFFTPRLGVKAVYTHDNTDPELHKEMYAQLVEHVKQLIDESSYKIDSSCSDISRVNNLSWDPDIYINPSPVPFHFDPTMVVKKKLKVVNGIANPTSYTYNGNTGDKSLEDIDRMTCNKYNMFGQGERHAGLVFFSYRCVENGIGYQEALLWAIDKFSQPGFYNDEIIKTIKSIYNS